MFGIGFGELVLVIIIVLLVNGPDRIPALAKKAARYIREFKRITDNVKRTIEYEINRAEEEAKKIISVKELPSISKLLDPKVPIEPKEAKESKDKKEPEK